MKKFLLLLLTLFLFGCGGGGGANNTTSESITGIATGSVSATDTNPVTGQLAIRGSTTNNSSIFATPNSLIGNYGNFTFNTTNGNWSYVINTTKTENIPAGSSASDTLTVRTLSGISAATLVITITQNSNGGGSSTPSNATGCPHSTLNDAWLNNRLGCLTAGQVLLKNTYTTYPEQNATTADIAITINEKVIDSNFYNVLTTDKARFFKYFICIKNAPSLSNTNTSWITNGVPFDLSDAVGGGNFSSTKPIGVSGMYYGATGGTEARAIEISCNSAIHPVIVDYTTKRIVGINPSALQSLTIYDY